MMHLMHHRQTSSGEQSSPSSTLMSPTKNDTNINNCISKYIIIKKGLLKKLKTGKKKYFVLNRDRDTGILWFEYYDSEKKYESSVHGSSGAGGSGQQKAKRSINISECFSITKRPLNTKTSSSKLNVENTIQNLMSVLVENEQETKDWFDLMVNHKAASLSILTEEKGQKIKQLERTYDHMWQVTILKKGLGLQPGMSGIHRVCLISRYLHFYSADASNEKYQRPLEFCLSHIRAVRSHKDDLVSLEMGRASAMGSGELIMQTEDTSCCQHMHEAIRETMKANHGSSDHSVSRPRSFSHSSDSRPSGAMSRTSLNSFPHHQHNTSHHRPSVTSPVTPSSTGAMTGPNGHDTLNSHMRDGRCGSLPSRSRCESENERVASVTHYSELNKGGADCGSSASSSRPNSGQIPFGFKHLSYSPPSAYLSPGRSTDSVGSSGSFEDYVEYDHRDSISRIHPFQPSIREEEGISEELSIPVTESNRNMMIREALHLPLRNVTHHGSFEQKSVTSPSQVVHSSDSPDHMSMSPVSSLDGGSSSRKTSETRDATDESEYLLMAPVSVDKQQILEHKHKKSNASDRSSVMSNESGSGAAGDSDYIEMHPGISRIENRPYIASGDGYNPLHHHHRNPHHHHSHHHHNCHHGSHRPTRVPSSLDSFILSEPSPAETASVKSEFHLEPVKSFISPADDNHDSSSASGDGNNKIPTRTYSMGSRPGAASSNLLKNSQLPPKLHPNPGDADKSCSAAGDNSMVSGDTTSESSVRIRAHSMGSHMSHLRERLKFRMNRTKLGSTDLKTEEAVVPEIREKSPDIAPPGHRVRSLTVGSRTALFPVSLGESQSSSTSSISSHKAKGSSVASESFDQDHMELDFPNQDSSVSNGNRRYSGSGHRSRSSAKSSFGNLSSINSSTTSTTSSSTAAAGEPAVRPSVTISSQLSSQPHSSSVTISQVPVVDVSAAQSVVTSSKLLGPSVDKKITPSPSPPNETPSASSTLNSTTRAGLRSIPSGSKLSETTSGIRSGSPELQGSTHSIHSSSSSSGSSVVNHSVVQSSTGADHQVVYSEIDFKKSASDESGSSSGSIKSNRSDD